MSFLQKLRMNNIFPTGGMNLGWSGQLPMYGGDDPLRDITDNFAVHRESNRPSQPSSGNLQRIANQNVSNTGRQPLKFGGVVGEQSNPGADILRRSAMNAERIWQDYKKPQETAGEILARAGIKQNEQFPGFKEYVDSLDMDTQLDRKKKIVDIDAAQRRITDAEKRTAIADYRSKNPNSTYKVIDGKLYALDGKGGVKDTGIAGMTKEEEIELNQNNALIRSAYENELNKNKPLTPRQITDQLFNKVHEARNRHPEWADYISPETGEVAAVGSGSGWGRTGLDENTRKQILDYLYGASAPTTPPVTTPPPAAPATPETSVGGYPTGTMERKNPDGSISTATTPPPTPAPSVTTPAITVPPPTTVAPQPIPQTPAKTNIAGNAKDIAPQQRIVGKVYLMGNGQPGVWTGKGFRPVQ